MYKISTDVEMELAKSYLSRVYSKLEDKLAAKMSEDKKLNGILPAMVFYHLAELYIKGEIVLEAEDYQAIQNFQEKFDEEIAYRMSNPKTKRAMKAKAKALADAGDAQAAKTKNVLQNLKQQLRRT